MTDLIPTDFAARVNALEPNIAGIHLQLDSITAAIAALSVRLNQLQRPTAPPPTPPTNTVRVTTSLGANKTMIGWTSIQNQDHSATTKAILASVSDINNSHIIGFGANNPIQTVEGGAYDFTYLDSIFGYPTPNAGYFPSSKKMCVTLCGSPPYMRQPRAGAQYSAPNPMGTPLTGLYDFEPVHWSQAGNFASMAAAIVTRYPQITDIHWWNEAKGYYFNTAAAGSVIVPPGSGLPARTGGNRNWIEGMTDCFNQVRTACKTARSTIRVNGPYLVCRSYTATPSSDLANGVYPMSLNGPWGYADKKILLDVMYFLENCVGLDVLIMDVKTSTNDLGDVAAYQWTGHQKLIDWQAWLRQLATYDSTKYGRAVANAATLNFWFAEAYSRIPSAVAFTPATHNQAVATDAWTLCNYVYHCDIECWMRWAPEGITNASGDAAAAHSISLWYDNVAPTGALTATEAKAVYQNFTTNFPVGTQMYAVETDDPNISGIASPTMLCVVSKSASPANITLNSVVRTLAPYEVAFIAR